MRVSLARRLVRPEATRCVRPRTLPAAAALRWAHGAADSPLPCAAVDPEEYERQLPPGLVAQTPSPALFVFMDAVRDNIATMLAHCDGDASRWRPHLKTTKMAPVYRELVTAGVRRFKCATVREAEVMLAVLRQQGVADADLLVAYPHVEPNLSLLGGLAAAHPETRLSVLAEDAEGVAAVPPELGVFVDVNVGMDRTGCPASSLPQIVAAAGAAAGSGQLRGLHFYDGHLTMADSAERRQHAHAAYHTAALVTNAVVSNAEVRAGSGAVSEIVTSGSTTFMDALAFSWGEVLPSAGADLCHTISPGTCVFHDARYDGEVEGLGLRPAALVLSRVVSRPTAGRLTLDAGSKGLAAEAGSPVAIVLGRASGGGAMEALTPSEEHLPCQLGAAAAEALPRGAHVWLFPRHVCPTVNMYDEAVLVDGGACEVVPVDARGH